MTLFWFIGFGSAIFIFFFLLYLQNNLIKKSRKNSNIKYRIFKKCMAINLLICTIVILFNIFVLPPILWSLSHKEVSIAEKVDDQKSIYPYSKATINSFVREAASNDGGIYAVSMDKANNSIATVDKKLTEIVPENKHLDAKIQYISNYKINQIPGKGLFASALNDIYANIYLSRTDATAAGTKVKIFIPTE